MECPRCGSRLERYTLGDRTAVTCGECGYAGVSVDHHSEFQTAETWADAISRVPDAGQIASVTVETATETPALELVFEPPSDTDDSSPDPTTVRIERPDPALAAALEAAENDEKFVCDVCGRAFERQEQLYGHLAVHTEGETEGT
jgi:DNA-directed RNA polymerase subunit M/transcription elongation factor TFIIS